MRKIVLFLIMIMRFLPLHAQSEELQPDDSVLELPEVLLEIEDISEQRLEALLPQSPPHIPEPEEFDLPEPPQLETIVELSILSPGDGPDTAELSPEKQQGDGVYLMNGTIGVGSMNHILGDLTVFRVGPGPQFTLQFIHERFDGYQFRPAGSGYFRQDDSLGGDLSWFTGRFGLDFSGMYRDTSNGLQGLGSYSSVQHTTLSGKGSFLYTAAETLSLKSGMEAMWNNETLTGDTPAGATELLLNPGISLLWEPEPVSFILTAEYEFRNTLQSGGLHRAGGNLSAEFSFPGELSFGGQVGIDWHNFKSIDIPFQLHFRKAFVPRFEFRFEGGYETVLKDYYELWNGSSFIRISSGLAYPDEKRWYGEGGVIWSPVPALTFAGEIGFSRYTSLIYPSESVETDTGMLVPASAEASILNTGVTLSWNTLDWLSLDLAWEGSFLDVPALLPRHHIEAGLDIHTSDRRWSGLINAALDPVDSLEIPELGVTVSFAPGPGILFSIIGEDLLAPAMTSPRTVWNYYETPGLMITFTAGISL